MKPSQNREEEIFDGAVKLSTAAERTAYLDGACGGDLDLRKRVEALLISHDEAGTFLQNPPASVRATVPPPGGQGLAGAAFLAAITEKAGDRIGRYKLLQQIGEGGCGVVYMAEQEEPVRRRVALKVIKLGMDTKSVIARFEAERQALALMDHPNIAKVLDAGATEAGRPYFVMELVRGVKISDYCDQNNLSTAQRLGLFVQVCHAIQHAHQKGIIHRDIKPSNILVTQHDSVAVPKVIDFGIAKATAGPLTDKTLFTAFEQFIGTPAYMSPEQAQMSGLDIDTRTDIYSLGVLLYELLTGWPPFDPERLFASGLDEIRRVIREQDPPKPSTRLSTLNHADLTTVAAHRHTEPPRLVHLIRGDLDWIVMKCLEKERTRRYESAHDLAADLQRHLGNEAVVARPSSAAYRLQKLVRRNKLAFVAGTAVALALVFGLVATTWEAVRAKRAEHAEADARNRAEQQAQLAAREAARATAGATAARRYAYAAEINVALQALSENNLSRARELLERQRPKAGEEDLRGFEWRHLWQLCRGDEFATFHDEGAAGLAFSPDGNLLAYASGKIIVRETASRKVVATLDSPASTLSFAPGGKLLASGADSGVKLWDTETWQERRSLPQAIHPSLFSPDGRWLLTGVAGGFRVWDTRTWQPAGDCPGAPTSRWQSRNGVAFSPDSQILLTIASAGAEVGDRLRVWRLPGLEELPPFKSSTEPIGSVAFSADGKHVLAGLWDGQLVAWDFATRRIVATHRVHTGWITEVAVAPDGKSFATSSSDRTINLWDATTFKQLARLRGHIGEVWCVAISPDGRTVASGSAEGTTKLWSGDARHADAALDGFGAVMGFIGGGRSLIAAKLDGLCVWTPDSGARMDFAIPTTPPIVSGAQPFGLKPDEPLAALGRVDGTMELWHLTTGAKLAVWSAHSNGIGAVVFFPDGQRLATASTLGEVKIWDFATRRELARLRPVDRKLLCLAISPGGNLLAASGESSRVWLWEVATGRELRQFPGLGNLVASVAFSPDGKLLAVASLANEARLWEVPSGQLRATLKGHVQGVIAVAFSLDGRTLVTGGMDRKVKLWNVATHQELVTYALGGIFPTLRFSPDGRVLAVGNLFESRIQLLRAPSFEEITTAERGRSESPASSPSL